MVLVYLSLGSNIENRDAFLAHARQAIKDSFISVRFSNVYETEPVDMTDQPWFLNQVAEVQTEMEPNSLLEWVRALEAKSGRQRKVPKGPRTLDVDILLYGDWLIVEDHLEIPHPRMAQRRHVLIPLSDLAPGLEIPGIQETVQEALKQLCDSSQVKIHAPS